MESFLFIFLLNFPGGFSLVTMITTVHIHVSNSKNWPEAQSYCREKYKDLSTITSDAEHSLLSAVAGNNFPNSWIGLHRSNTNKSVFLWSDGGLPTSFYHWKSGQPGDINSGQDCVETVRAGWADYECYHKLPLFCFKSTVLESDKKTWDKAQEHCRDHYTDLASLTSNQQLQQVEGKIVGEEFVWVGLRFLAGNWSWLNGEPLDNDVLLPECPIYPHRCGARNLKTRLWVNINCEESLSFLCDWM